MNTRKMELLAPVGGMSQLKAAVRFGADAVYGGMQRFGLRAYAGNFAPDQLRQAVIYAHENHVKFYVTLNVLPTDKELDDFLDTARDALDAGVDAAIVSDIGAALMLHQELPQLPIHISTQANVLNSRTALHLHQAMGAQRIVLSRELSLEDIKAMRMTLPKELELEAFVHGAMCVAYSGRCLLSAAMMGRSGNKGACAQPCRWQYNVTEIKRPNEQYPVCVDEHGTYLFSAYDLCMLPHLVELRDAGVVSLKIEGRMKTAYYVATVVSAYRRALDLLETEGEEAYRATLAGLVEELNKASHRLSNTGFYFGSPTPPSGADGFRQDMEYVGDFVEAPDENGEALIRLKNRFFVGDELEALTPGGVYRFTVRSMKLAETGEALSAYSVAGACLRIPVDFPVAQGDILRGPNRNHQ